MSQLQNRVDRLEQTETNTEAPIHFFTIYSPEEEEAVNVRVKDLPANAVIFRVIYEPRPVN